MITLCETMGKGKRGKTIFADKTWNSKGQSLECDGRLNHMVALKLVEWEGRE